jgi:hypothetical protein
MFHDAIVMLLDSVMAIGRPLMMDLLASVAAGHRRLVFAGVPAWHDATMRSCFDNCSS